MSETEQAELISLAKMGDKEAMRKLVGQHSRLVIYWAKKYSCSKMPFEDIYQEGVIGLMRAIQKFDLDKEYKFSTYASTYITGYIQRSLGKEERVRLPSYMFNHYVRYKQMMSRMESGELPQMTEKEQQEYLNVSPSSYRYLVEHSEEIVSLDTKIPNKNGEDMSLLSIIPNPSDINPESVYLKKEDSETCCHLMKCLTEKEATIIKYRMGFYGNKVYTLDEIGKIMNLSRERIRQIESKAMDKMKNSSFARKYQKYS